MRIGLSYLPRPSTTPYTASLSVNVKIYKPHHDRLVVTFGVYEFSQYFINDVQFVNC